MHSKYKKNKLTVTILNGMNTHLFLFLNVKPNYLKHSTRFHSFDFVS